MCVTAALGRTVRVPVITGESNVGVVAWAVTDAAGNVNLSLPEDEYTITITAESLTPAVLEIFLDNDLTIPVELKNEDVIWEDGFNDLLQWEIINGNWTVEDGYLKSQPELVYDNGINWTISSVNELQLDSEDSLIIELTMRYELEWDLDHFSVVFNHNNDSTVMNMIYRNIIYHFISRMKTLQLEIFLLL